MRTSLKGIGSTSSIFLLAAVPRTLHVSRHGPLCARYGIIRILRFMRGAAVAAMGLRMAREALRHRRFHYLLLATAVIVTLGAICIYSVEHGTNKSIATLDDAFWWAIVTTTTVGYGDVSPVTGEGRVVAVVLMLLGIGFLGVLTATITSFFFDQGTRCAGRGVEAAAGTDRSEAGCSDGGSERSNGQ